MGVLSGERSLQRVAKAERVADAEAGEQRGCADRGQREALAPEGFGGVHGVTSTVWRRRQRIVTAIAAVRPAIVMPAMTPPTIRSGDSTSFGSSWTASSPAEICRALWIASSVFGP